MTALREWQGVFFDLDGTLADTVELILCSYRHTMKVHLGEALPDQRWLSTIGTPLVSQLRGFARNEAEVERMLETFTVFQRGLHDDMVRPFPGAGALLDTLRAGGIRLAVITSKRRAVASQTLEVCGLRNSIDLLVTVEDVDHGKPDPESVEKALSALGLTDCREEVLFVGDSPFDLQAGRAAGTRTAGVSWGPFERRTLEAEHPDYFLETFEDLLRLR
ncbi:MAG: HAD-IA family hydrolase [Gemmatimonadetes bacterium]|nr:HAD-IA family hydrolase [Gemmatimonadota bacterium]